MNLVIEPVGDSYRIVNRDGTDNTPDIIFVPVNPNTAYDELENIRNCMEEKFYLKEDILV